MQRVIVTVKRQGESRVRDLEVPAEVEAQRLAQMIANALNWNTSLAGQPLEYQIEAHPPGRILQSDESLASAGVWDGAWLVLHSEKGARVVKPSESKASPSRNDSPLTGGPTTGKWRPLGAAVPSTNDDSTPPGEEKRETDFRWKQLD